VTGSAVPWGAEAVSVSFGGLRALDQVSVGVRPGQVTAVVGGDGAGKTTLLRCVAGALAVAGGTVRRPNAERIGYLPSGTGVYDDLSLAENLEFRSAVYGKRDAADAREVGEYLERTGLATARDRLAGHLSGGMRRKLGVIAAMLPEPELLVLDEPTTGVDPVSRADLWWLIARAVAGGAAVLMSTTYLDEATRAAHVLVLDAGRTLAAGTPAEIVASVPGTIVVVPGRPDDEDERRRAWRRAGTWRVWQPAGQTVVSQTVAGQTVAGQTVADQTVAGQTVAGQPVVGQPAEPPAGPSVGVPAPELVTPDLQDAVCVAALRAELEAVDARDR
jgi:ABC-2 type transport system ATP-binding protein